MKLFISLTSVFARKVRIVVREKGLTSRVEEIARVPVENAADLVAANPLAQIPALIDDSGVSWSDSGLISAWLDGQGNGPRLLPDYGSPAYWQVKRVETMAAGMTEMLAKMIYEGRRPENERSPYWLGRWQDNLLRAFSAADAICPPRDVFDMGSLSLAIAATFCDFRRPELDWRGLAPKVAALQAELEQRPAFVATHPRLA